MKTPRCGMTDIAASFNLKGTFWRKDPILWHFRGATNKQIKLATVAFQLWEKYANVNFQQSFENPNIIISFKYWNEEPYDISKDKLSLFITLACEIGYAIGIDHSPIHQSLMHPFYHEPTSPFNAEDFELSDDDQLAVASFVGLYYPFEFASVVKYLGGLNNTLYLKKEEWIQFHEQRENINKYFQTFDTMWKPRQIGSKTLTFEMIEEKKILKIEDMSENEVYLGWESVSEVWSLESVLRYRLIYSSGSKFKYFAVAEMSGDVKINIYNIINRLSEKSDDVCCMLEVLLFYAGKGTIDVQLERRIQEQEIQFIKKMWMLYAQEHWTKAFDLKSAVERLYEELGALEFDADHKAIYGMERYYTVPQCEELRDKYKIRRKVCRKFLQGKTCSQCLVKRISEIGLRHFLDTINKHIKDCSDSSSSSDEEVFKAVEQNGEETTEEE
ncbi:hypothetical protein FQA39_LY18809 [Lamprigera yunnana]|nr:hypothetical protein FQA39_LY18809 [Lamprigera yunnana]